MNAFKPSLQAQRPIIFLHPSSCTHFAIVTLYVSIYVLSTQFYAVVVFFASDSISHFFSHSQKFPFTLFGAVLTRSLRSKTVMARHKSHFPPSRLNNDYGIFDQIVVLQLSPPASFVLLLLQKKGEGELWLTRYKNKAIKIQIFITGSSKIQFWRVKAENYYQCHKICTGEPFNKCCSGLGFHQKIGVDWREEQEDRTWPKQWLYGRTREEREASSKNLRDQRVVMRDDYQRLPATCKHSHTHTHCTRTSKTHKGIHIGKEKKKCTFRRPRNNRPVTCTQTHMPVGF